MILNRYIGSTVIKAIFMTLLVLTILTFVLTFIEEIEDIGKGDYRLLDAFMVAFSTTPRFIYEAFPVSALIGSLLGLGSLASHGELVAIRAAGVSLRRVVFSVIKAGFFMMVLVVVVGDLLAPVTEQYGQRLRLEKQNKQVTFHSRHGFWAKDGNAVVNIKSVRPGGQLKDLTIYEFDEQKRLQLVTLASEAEYVDPHWQMKGVRQSSISDDGVFTRRLKRAKFDSVVNPAMLDIAVVKPFMLPVWELYEYVETMKASGQEVSNYAVAFWTKLATPVATVVMLILAVPFVLGGARSVSTGQRVFAGALLGTLFYLFSRGFSFLVLVYEWPPFLVLLFPVAVFIFAMLFFLQQTQLRGANNQ